MEGQESVQTPMLWLREHGDRPHHHEGKQLLTGVCMSDKVFLLVVLQLEAGSFQFSSGPC